MPTKPPNFNWQTGGSGSRTTATKSPRRQNRGDPDVYGGGTGRGDLETYNVYKANVAPGTPFTAASYVPFARDYRTGMAAIRAAGNQTQPGVPAGPGGGGRGGGGGGGGGGGSALTQAMFDSMLGVLGTRAPGLALQTVDLPDFQGTPLAAFNAAPYTQALGQVNTAVTADQAASAAAGKAADTALRANYTNSYANAPVVAGPQAGQVGNALQATAGGGGEQAAVAAQSNAASQSDQASFANLLNVLAAADTQAQGSRLNQVALDQATAGRNINAQALGLRGGINMSQAQAQNQWQQAAAERDYQNSMMRQQWNRDELTRNQDITNQQRQGNWQQSNEMISNRLGPLLDLLGSTQGTKITTDALTKLLQGWGK